MLDAELLRTTFDLVIDRRPDLTVRFYEVLFQRYPDLEPMFRGSRSMQAKMLAYAISAVIDHLDDAAWLEETLGNLGSRHAGYGVTAAMYGQVGDALLVTLAEVAGDDWSPEVQEQWTLAYTAIASMMQAGVGQREVISADNAA
ncbi:MAG TPA: globin domain-containing protein [Kofleriaceae bacterium]